MISIASETNSVQIDSTEETNVNQETNGKQEPNVSQKTNENQTEELHIAEGTTSGEQSGAEHSSKYGYAIFEGYAGEEYLKDLVREILPAALYRTWAIAVGFQAPTNACYVGISKIAEKAKRGVRQIQKDKREMQLRGLLARYAGPVQVKEKDGTWSRKVRIINDFGGLYDLAYEYHEWKRSAEYVEAEWEVAEYIREDEELYEKLIRFDCYRRILICEKPGPKTELSELHQVYKKRRKQNEQEREQKDNGQQEAKTNKYLPKQLIKSSPYQESKNPLESIIKENTDSKEDLEEGVFESVEPQTIRNVEQIETRGEEQRENKAIQKRNERDEIQRRIELPSNQIEPQQKEEKEPAAAKEEKEYTVEDIKNNPLAMALFAMSAYDENKRKEEACKQRNERKSEQKKRQRNKTPEQLSRTTVQIVQYLGGNPTYQQSDITRVTKIYWACTQMFTGFSNGWFLNQLTEACNRTCKRRKVSNRVAYFFTCLEGCIDFTLEELAYLRSTESLYTDGDLHTFVLWLQQTYEKSESQLDYGQWIKQTYHLKTDR